MNIKHTSFLSFMIVCGLGLLINAHHARAFSLPEDLTQPFEYGGYTVNMPLILAQDSVLWELLEDFDKLGGEDDGCEAKTMPFVSTHRTELEAIFPWFSSGDADFVGAGNFCDILGYIPEYMGQSYAGAGVLSPLEGFTTNIFDSGTVPNWHAIENLTFDHPLVRVEFTETIDLLSYDFVNMVLGFAPAFDAETGFLSLNSDMITGLKSTGAIITFKNIENFDDPVVLIDGKLDEKIVSNLVYDPEAKTVTCNTKHFTSFEVVERSSVPVVEDDDEESEDCKKISGNNAYKKAYQRVKYYKNHDEALYLALKSVYHTYRTVGDPARDMLMQTDITTYDKYKKYRRYHKYKECK